MNQLLIVLSHIMDQFNNNLHRINDVETYHTQTIDSFAKIYGGKRIYPSPDLISKIDYVSDLEELKKYKLQKLRVKLIKI